jgi:spherulation-specific family 4 protein
MAMPCRQDTVNAGGYTFHMSNGMLSVAVLTTLLSACGSARQMPANTPSPITTPTPSSARVGLIIPMYMYPGPAWDQVVSQKLSHPRVPMLLIANPEDGSGSASNQDYNAAITKAQSAGIRVLGYVYSAYGQRPAQDIESEISNYNRWYHVDGIFIDEMATNNSAYYQGLTAYAHGLHLLPVVGNPGVDAPANAGTDIINYFEHAGYPGLEFLAQPEHARDPAMWSYMSGQVPFDFGVIASTLPYVKYLYATDDAEPECYCRLPSYFQQLTSLLDR